MENSDDYLQDGLRVDPISFNNLKETARWAKLLAIVGFVVSALLVLAAVFAGAFFTSLTQGAGPQAMGGLLSVLYVLIAIVYFGLSLFLYRFATRMQVALLNTDQESFNLSLHNLKLVYRIMGILIIIYLGILVLGMIFALGVTIFSGR